MEDHLFQSIPVLAALERPSQDVVQEHIELLDDQLYSQRLDQLTQKYRNYLVSKDFSISVEESVEGWGEKESKKLNQLLRQDNKGQQKFFQEVPSIDSVQMATSPTNRNKTDIPTDDPSKKAKISLIQKLKASRAKIEQEVSRLPTVSHLPMAEYSKKNRKNESKGKSKGKLVETKRIQKSPVLGLMTTITQGSSKKLKQKKSPKQAQLRGMVASEQFKSKSNQFSSVKNVQPIRMNKVKGACKMAATTFGLPSMRSLQTFRVDKSSRECSKKGSKGKSINSFKSKKSMSNSNSSSKTPLKKRVTPSKDKIYTTIKQTIRRR